MRVQIVQALFSLSDLYRSVVVVNGARKYCAGDTGRIKAPDLVEHARRAVQGDDLRDLIAVFVDIGNELGRKVLE